MEAFVLAGGESKRFGSNKALFEIGGEPVVSMLCRRLSPLFDRVRILARENILSVDPEFEVLADVRQEQSPLVGIYSGLKHLGEGKAFFVACDLPLVRQSLVKYLVLKSPGYDAVVPRTEKGLEPLCAVYDASCLGAIELALSSGDLKADSFLKDVNVVTVGEETLKEHDPRMLSFWNVNSRADMAFVVETIARERTKRCS